MADDFVTLKVNGLDDLRQALDSIPKKLRKRALRNALAAGARIVRDAAKQAAPVLKQSNKYRKPGTVRDAIKVRTSKAANRGGDVGVFVNVKPAKGAAKGAKSPNDPFYWRFLNFGTKKKNAFGVVMEARGFLQTGASKLPEALEKFEATLGPQIQKLDTNPKDPL